MMTHTELSWILIGTGAALIVTSYLIPPRRGTWRIYVALAGSILALSSLFIPQ